MRVALLGCGVVGSEVARLLSTHAGELAQRVGAPVELVGIAVARPVAPRPGDLDPALFTADSRELVKRADVVIELIGGIEPARTLILDAMAAGASVVTANKALLGQDGPRLHEAAAAEGVDLYYEASVAGGIPLLRPIRESLAGDRINRVLGIVNGTTNYVLDQMDRTGAQFADALAQAQQLGYAETDPTADIEGYDAASKAAILASLAFHTRVGVDDVYREGITQVTAETVASAKAIGAVVKLLAICERVVAPDGGERVSARVHPVMLPASHPLAGVREAFNAVFVEADAAGQLMFYGQGAGGKPTASAVLGDVITAARNRVVSSRGPGESAYADLPIRPMGEVITRYHVSLDVADKPGVLAQVATAFAANDVSIETVRQAQRPARDGAGVRADLVIVTHAAPDAALRATVEALAVLPVVTAVSGVTRVEGEH